MSGLPKDRAAGWPPYETASDALVRDPLGLHWPIVRRCNAIDWQAATEDKWLCAQLLERAGLPQPPILAMIDTTERAFPGTRIVRSERESGEVNTGGAFNIPQLAGGRGFLTDRVLDFFRACGSRVETLRRAPRPEVLQGQQHGGHEADRHDQE